MADVRTFRAATMQEALDLVRNELGADAVILHTRQVAKRRLLPWRKPAEEVEITASLTLDVGSSSGRRSAKRSTSTAAVRTGTSIDLPAAPQTDDWGRPVSAEIDSTWFPIRRIPSPTS